MRWNKGAIEMNNVPEYQLWLLARLPRWMAIVVIGCIRRYIMLVALSTIFPPVAIYIMYPQIRTGYAQWFMAKYTAYAVVFTVVCALMNVLIHYRFYNHTLPKREKKGE
jgi:hypothetical protein